MRSWEFLCFVTMTICYLKKKIITLYNECSNFPKKYCHVSKQHIKMFLYSQKHNFFSVSTSQSHSIPISRFYRDCVNYKKCESCSLFLYYIYLIKSHQATIRWEWWSLVPIPSFVVMVLNCCTAKSLIYAEPRQFSSPSTISTHFIGKQLMKGRVNLSQIRRQTSDLQCGSAAR